MVYWNIWIENTLHAYVTGSAKTCQNAGIFKNHFCMTEVWMTILESGWNQWVWLVGVVSRWVWLVGGIYGYGYHV